MISSSELIKSMQDAMHNRIEPNHIIMDFQTLLDDYSYEGM